jgi:type IV pilus assembly protein PilM
MKLLSLLKTIAPTASEQKKDRVVGIDIGSSSIKVVELQSREGVVTLTTYGELQLGPYGDKEIGEIFSLTPDLEKQALSDILRESATKATEGAFAIPLSVSFVTVVSLEAEEDEDLDPRIRVEARKYIPVPLAEVVLDWAEIEKNESEVARNILLAAIQNKPLQRFNTLLSGVGMAGMPTEIECFSTIRGAGISTKETAAVIDFGATSAKLYITRKGLLQRMYRMPIGSSQVTAQLATQLGQSFVDAEILKKTIATNDEQFATVQKTYVNHYNRALTEFSHVLKEYSATTGFSFDTVVLTGSGTLFPDFTKQVAEALEQPVIVSNPFEMVAYPAFMEDTLREIGPTFTTALGSALRSFI